MCIRDRCTADDPCYRVDAQAGGQSRAYGKAYYRAACIGWCQWRNGYPYIIQIRRYVCYDRRRRYTSYIYIKCNAGPPSIGCRYRVICWRRDHGWRTRYNTGVRINAKTRWKRWRRISSRGLYRSPCIGRRQGRYRDIYSVNIGRGIANHRYRRIYTGNIYNKSTGKDVYKRQ